MTQRHCLQNASNPDHGDILAPVEPEMCPPMPAALIVHENPALRRILRNVLTERLGIVGVMELDNLDCAIDQLAMIHGVTLVIISLDLHGVMACRTIRLLRQHFPGIRLAVLSPCQDRLETLLYLAAGVHGQIDITASAEDLAEALDLVNRGRVAVPSGFAEVLPDPSRFDDEDGSLSHRADRADAAGQLSETNVHHCH